MPAPRLQKLELQGFRSFGTGRQSFDLSATVTAVWGGNSQGKTSLAEALEFLFTGQIARRELLASAKDEFAESLRNVHIPAAAAVFIEAHIVCADGATRRLRRTLLDDFKGGAACKSQLELDGKSCTESDLAKQVGLKLMPAPLRAPVLSQHTLGYIFSVAPTDRAAYFRAVLDTQELEDFRSAVASLESALPPPVVPELDKLIALEAISELSALAKKMRAAKTKADLGKHISAALKLVLDSAGIASKPTGAERAEQLHDALEHRRAQTFPTSLFSRRPFTGWKGVDEPFADTVKKFEQERRTVEAETRRLIALFKAALSIEAVDAAHEPIDCPLCATPAALTPARVAHIREQVAANQAYQDAEKAARLRLQELEGALAALNDAVPQALPKFARIPRAARQEQRFTMAGLRALVPDTLLIGVWSAAYRRLRRSTRPIDAAVHSAREQITTALGDVAHWKDASALFAVLDTIPAAVASFEAAQLAYAEPVRQLSEALHAAVDKSASTAGWADLVGMGRHAGPLWQSLESQRRHVEKLKAVQDALKHIDDAVGKVTDEKFGALSQDVRSWWERLRPDEPSFFEAVKRRGVKTRRAATEFFRAMLNRYRAGDRVTAEDSLDLAALLERHTEYVQKVGRGVNYFTVMMTEHGTQCFRVIRKDGTGTDFSYPHCIKGRPPTRKQEVTQAFRKVVRIDLFRERDKFIAQHKGSDGLVPCGFTGERIAPDEGHIDHKQPMIFEVIVSTFLQGRGLAFADVPITNGQDEQVTPELTDAALAEEFGRYHAGLATLEFVKARANLAQSAKHRLKSGRVKIEYT